MFASNSKQTELHCIITGRVQGVNFRNFAQAIAKDLGIKGFVANLPDGSVEILAQGSYGVLKVFKNHLIVGPKGSIVREFYEDWGGPSKEFDDFKIINT